jgi:hypothetical protein
MSLQPLSRRNKTTWKDNRVRFLRDSGLVGIPVPLITLALGSPYDPNRDGPLHIQILQNPARPKFLWLRILGTNWTGAESYSKIRESGVLKTWNYKTSVHVVYFCSVRLRRQLGLMDKPGMEYTAFPETKENRIRIALDRGFPIKRGRRKKHD